jgi:hypothetical protein
LHSWRIRIDLGLEVPYKGQHILQRIKEKRS